MVDPFSVSTTHGFRRGIVGWLETNYARTGGCHNDPIKQNMASVWQELLVVFGGNATLLIVLGFLFRSLLSQMLTKDVETYKAQLKADADVSIERLKSTLQMAALEHRVQFEEKLSNQRWKRERKCELQLKAIDSVNAMANDFIANKIADCAYTPTREWFGSFGVTDAIVKALFDEKAYASYQNLEKRIDENLGSAGGKTFAQWEFCEARDGAIKAMFNSVID